VAKSTVHYVDPQVGYSFTVPLGWGLQPRPAYNPPGTCVDLRDPESAATVTVCGKAHTARAGDIDPELSRGETERVQLMSGRTAFTLRPGSPAWGSLAGQRTLTHFADFSNGPTRTMTEWTTWVQSERTRSSIVVTIPAQDFEGFRTRFAPILNSYRIP
jgi:hypothetical protein